jgi:hypothetical protein
MRYPFGSHLRRQGAPRVLLHHSLKTEAQGGASALPEYLNLKSHLISNSQSRPVVFTTLDRGDRQLQVRGDKMHMRNRPLIGIILDSEGCAAFLGGIGGYFESSIRCFFFMNVHAIKRLVFCP